MPWHFWDIFGGIHTFYPVLLQQAASEEPTVAEKTTVTREYTREVRGNSFLDNTNVGMIQAFSKTEVQTLSPTGMAQQQPGYTVSTVPTEWKLAPKERLEREN